MALLFTFVTHSHSSHFDATYRIRAGGNAPSGFCDIGDFDLETWACDLAGQNTTKTMHNILTTQCAVSSASRWILVPFFVTGFLGTVVGWWALGSAAERVKEKSEETPGKGEENDGWGT